MTLRSGIPMVLLVAGAVAVALAVVAGDVTWRAVWIGLASTALAAGLVDGSAVLEARRRERAILDVAGERVGRIHQRLLWILGAVFEAGKGEVAAVSGRLNRSEQSTYDPTAVVDGLWPERTMAVYVQQCIAQIDDALEVALALGVQTSEAARFVRLDAALREGPFALWLREASVLPMSNGAKVLARQAADVLDRVQEEFRFFAARDRPGWRFGRL
jgi:hypothetical protein